MQGSCSGHPPAFVRSVLAGAGASGDVKLLTVGRGARALTRPCPAIATAPATATAAARQPQQCPPVGPPLCPQLAVIRAGGRVLLGRKKRGFGEGYVNGFGGKVEPGEGIAAAAAREVRRRRRCCRRAAGGVLVRSWRAAG